MMITLLGIGTLSLLGLALGENTLSKQKKWNPKPASLKRSNDLVSSYVNTLDVCAGQVPRCPAKAEPRCFQDTQWHTSPPTQKNTMWRCILCENTRRGKQCFMVLPIEAYTSKKRPMHRKKTRDINPPAGNPPYTDPPAYGGFYSPNKPLPQPLKNPKQRSNFESLQNYPYGIPYVQQHIYQQPPPPYQAFQPMLSPYAYIPQRGYNPYSPVNAYQGSPVGNLYRWSANPAISN